MDFTTELFIYNFNFLIVSNIQDSQERKTFRQIPGAAN
jgi:hypothetical protein